MWVAVATAVGLIVGELMRRQLNRLAYRLPPEQGERAVIESANCDPSEIDTSAASNPTLSEVELPDPGRRLWVPLVLAGTWGAILWLLPNESWSDFNLY